MHEPTPPTSAKTHHPFPIFIDDDKYDIDAESMSGAQLRQLVPVPSDRDLWLESHGPKDDILIRPEGTYEVSPGSHFYTAPSTINPGGA